MSMLRPTQMMFEVLIFSAAPMLRADLPVHCLHHEVAGEWRFTLGLQQAQRSSCGHLRPDTPRDQPSRHVVDGTGPTTAMAVNLLSPNVASTGRDPAGSWTMVYDEGFSVKVEGLDFFAFSNFTFDDESKPGYTKRNHSHCFQTMVGWYQNMDRTKFGCFYGSKIATRGQAFISQAEHATHNSLWRQASGATAAHRAGSEKQSSMALTKVAFGANQKLDEKVQHHIVRRLNAKLSALRLGWRAKAVAKWTGRTMHNLNKYAGFQRSAPRATTAALHRPSPQPTLRGSSFLQQRQLSTPTAGSHRDTDSLPREFDWSNVQGRNFLEPVMDQADCGSCYAASSVRMLTARHKIRQNDTEAAPWSINFPLFCSEYNQGCDGGYGILTARWSGDVGLLPEECMKYNTSGECRLQCDLDKLKGKRFRAANHRYVGSWYGNSSVDAIKAELIHGGPLVLGLEPAEDFMFYSEGIYRTSLPLSLLQVGSLEWQRVDHAVLLVGWGMDQDGTRYWRIQNSWGSEWGEAGFFRIIMDENESGIESIAEVADVIEDEQKGQQVSAFFNQLASGVATRSKPEPQLPQD